MTRVNNLLTIHNYVIMNTYLSDIICDLLESQDPDGQPIPIPILTAGENGTLNVQCCDEQRQQELIYWFKCQADNYSQRI